MANEKKMKQLGSGYVNCKCRDCFEIAIADDMTVGAFCVGCVEAGCPDYQSQPRMSHECMRPDAYGCEDMES